MAKAADPLTQDEVQDKLIIWQQRLELLHWSIELRFHDYGEDPEGHTAEVDAQDRLYNRAILQINQLALSDWPADAWGIELTAPADQVLAHELLHVATAEVDQAALGLIEEQLHRDVFAVYAEAYHRARERSIEGIAIALFNGWGSA